MKYKIERPSGHVVKRFDADGYDAARNVFEDHLSRIGGCLELFEGDELIITSGAIEERIFNRIYEMRNGRNTFMPGTRVNLLSKTKTDVHVDIRLGRYQWERFTLPRKDFFEATL